MSKSTNAVTKATDEQKKEPATMTGSDSQTSHQTTEAQKFADPRASKNNPPLKSNRSSSMKKPDSQFISVSGTLINSNSVAGAIVVNSPDKPAVILLDKTGRRPGWMYHENLEQAVEMFNAVVYQMPKVADTLYIQDRAVIPFEFISRVTTCLIQNRDFLVVDGHYGRSLLMFDSELYDELDVLQDEIMAILMRQVPNKMICVSSE
ncbi:MAG: hypothetical protein IBX50_12540 [Marinospirillum sp.]|uniref:hypothetical protein n=1 Tax=Marinospirillum sp. TaxID=2183934 RepID=UPI0019E3421F|nr:hypothetical protein [Marinospirillum sp.]MBE0507525.1 hypothetical protein [Marinospirillum sp.]